MLRASLARARRAAVAVTAALALCAFDWIGKIELDAAGLASDDATARAAAVRRLARYDIAFTRDHLLAALRDPSVAVRTEAARILAQRRVLAAVPTVIGWLSEPDPAVKRAAAQILGDLGDDRAVAPLVRALADPNPQVRHDVVVALGTIGTPSVVVPLLGRLEDDKADVRRAAVDQLASLGDRRAVIPLVGAFADASADVRVAAVRAVGRLGDRAAVPALVRLFRDPNPRVRAEAVDALGNLEAVDAADILISELRRGALKRDFRERVAFALGKLGRAGDARAVTVLVETLADPRLRAAATEALRVAGRAAVPALVRHLDGELAGDPASAVALLRDAADPAATDALVRELGRGRVSRGLVLDALGAAGDRRALVPVLTLLDDADPAVRRQAMRALRPLLDAPAADVLIGAMDDDDPEVRSLAAEYLGILASRAAVPRLARAVRDGHPLRLRYAAAEALGRIGDARAVPALVDALRAGPSPLRRAAADALAAIADESAVPPLLALVRGDVEADARGHAARALGGVLRDRPRADARAALAPLCASGPVEVSLAAIGALGAMADPAARDTLVAVARTADPERRRAAVAALGALADPAAAPAVRAALRARDDRVAAAAAWALGDLGDVAAVADLAHAAARGGWATAINAAGSVARLARPDDAPHLLRLLHHRDPLVRANAAWGLGRLEAADARAALAVALRRDRSWLVRRAAARALGAIGGADDALAAAADGDDDERVRAAAARARGGERFTPPARTEWRAFAFVQPEGLDAPVRGEPYYVVGGDGLVQALYTDARGEWTAERFPPGDAIVRPRGEAP
ncbi:MAG: HEAT repeat domain-containing protein [Deltaproteobacteria bacterium]|nr:MAG: HEAT repeat domain-containing protein [Deltaproteobacteria bacterium]